MKWQEIFPKENIYYQESEGIIYKGDSRKILKGIPDNSIDAVITDPPYELGFMGKEWDRKGVAFDVNLWKECLRVLKPGGHLLSFGGTRTYHRMACAVEDAGFEVRDMIEWVYGSGFPKSLNIGKAVDKIQGNERVLFKYEHWGRMNRSYQPSGSPFNFDKSKVKVEQFKSVGFSEWEGWGTALKPAHEPILLARKPLEKGLSIAENCLKWGVGGLNIDGCRVGTEKVLAHHAPKGTFAGGEQNRGSIKNYYENQGRFPANFIWDGSDEVKKCFPKANGCANNPTAKKIFNNELKVVYRNGGYRDEGSASRFFKSCPFTEADSKSLIYCPKASKKERNMGLEEMSPKIDCDRNPKLNSANVPMNRSGIPKTNFHPTVKPLKLMEYLVNMITRPNQIVLDPFLGSGTTAMACKKLGRRFIGIEILKDYCEIAKKRLEKIPKSLV